MSDPSCSSHWVECECCGFLVPVRLSAKRAHSEGDGALCYSCWFADEETQESPNGEGGFRPIPVAFYRKKPWTWILRE